LKTTPKFRFTFEEYTSRVQTLLEQRGKSRELSQYELTYAERGYNQFISVNGMKNAIINIRRNKLKEEKRLAGNQ